MGGIGIPHNWRELRDIRPKRQSTSTKTLTTTLFLINFAR